MRRWAIALLALAVIWPACAWAEPERLELDWRTIPGGIFTGKFYGAAVSGDGWLVAGQAFPAGKGEEYTLDGQELYSHMDGWLVRLDASGKPVEKKALGGSGEDGLMDVIALPEGGYLAVGFTASYDGDLEQLRAGAKRSGRTDGWVVRLDEALQVVWQRVLGGNGVDSFRGVTATPDGGFLLVGYTASTGKNVRGLSYRRLKQCAAPMAWAVKLTGEGETEWTTCMGGSESDDLYGALCLEEGYLLYGSSWSSNADLEALRTDGVTNGWLVWLSAAGELEEHRLLTQAADVSLLARQEAGYTLAGTDESHERYLLAQLDDGFSEQGRMAFGQGAWGGYVSGAQLASGELAVSGMAFPEPPSELSDIRVSLVNGVEEQQALMLGEGGDVYPYAMAAGDQKFLVIGWSAEMPAVWQVSLRPGQ